MEFGGGWRRADGLPAAGRQPPPGTKNGIYVLIVCESGSVWPATARLLTRSGTRPRRFGSRIPLYRLLSGRACEILDPLSKEECIQEALDYLLVFLGQALDLKELLAELQVLQAA